MKIKILDASTLGADMDLSVFETFGELTVYSKTSPDEVVKNIGDADVIIINKVKVGEHNLPECKNLKLICVMATGYDNIGTEYCKANNIAVCNVVGYSSQSVAQITVAMVLSLVSHLNEYRDAVADGSYTRGGVANMLTPVYHEICGKTWGIVGYGNIGSQVGRVAEALGCRVIVNKRTPTEGVECVDIDTLCRESDIITVHTPLTPDTKNLINEHRIKSMKPDAIFVNMARGLVADEAALADAIETGKLGGLGIDVYSIEPFGTDHPYFKIAGLSNVCLTPHMSWGAYEARVRCRDEVMKNIEAFLNGEKRNRVV
ncbi:MAG: hydroxyacid dehydrogenase [Ruminococcaceae bacterium]|nr:hydroxyacid dehydrogenase [Oscillospiraceae bacterium]